MKLNILLSILAAVMLWATCKNLKSSQTTQASPDQNQPAAAAGPSGWRASHVIEGNNPDSLGTLQIQKAPDYVNVPVDALPPATASHRAYLSTGYWHLNMAFQPSDTTVHHNYQHKWLKFREDQTFDILVKGKPVDTGRWNWDETKNEIYLSCNDPYINNTWSVLEKGFVMIWKGNTELNVTGIQIRVVGSGQIPSDQ